MTEVALQRGSAAIPEAEHRLPPTSKEKLDDAVAALRAHADAWVKLGLPERIELLERLREGTLTVAERWVAAACRAKGIPQGTPAEGEEWLGGPATTVRNLTLLIRSLKDIQRFGKPQLPGEPKVRPNGQVAAPVFPTDRWDAILFGGFTAEVWMDPSVTLSNLEDTMAVFYARPPAQGRVALVLGAGNVNSIGPMDALYKLFVEGEVVVLKMNPVNEYMGPILEDAFAALIRRGFLRIVYGGAAEGDYLCTHPGVDTIHITGSDKTHDAIVWGVGEEGRRRKAEGTPRNDKPITSELGNVTPFIVVPGPWSQRELDWHGMNVVSSLTNNAGFNCNATRVVITHAGWSKRRAFLEAIERAFQQVAPRSPYYPGAEDRQRAFLEQHPDAKVFGPRGEGRVPWTWITGLDPAKDDEICFTTEAWCGVTSEVPLPADDVVAYIEAAVAHANEKL